MINEHIPARFVQMVDQKGSLLPPLPKQEILDTVDPFTSFLAMVSPPGHKGHPVCKIFNRTAELRRLKSFAKSSKSKYKSGVPKQIELNWAIDPHDFEHRLDQMQNFLRKGYKVEVIMARKRGGRRATLEEGKRMVHRLHERIKEVNGASESKPMEGAVLGEATLFFQGASQQPGKPGENVDGRS
jgi:translation initiation factor IF-3